MNLLKNKMAEGYILSCIMTVIFCMIAAVVIYFLTIVSMVRAQKKNFRMVLDSFVIENAIDIYNSIKLGRDEQYSLSSEKLNDKLCSFCNLKMDGSYLCFYDESDELRYKLSNPILKADNDLKITASYTLSVPICFCGRQITTAKIPIRINANYNEKF